MTVSSTVSQYAYKLIDGNRPGAAATCNSTNLTEGNLGKQLGVTFECNPIKTISGVFAKVAQASDRVTKRSSIVPLDAPWSANVSQSHDKYPEVGK